jgi:hypothetical protein
MIEKFQVKHVPFTFKTPNCGEITLHIRPLKHGEHKQFIEASKETEKNLDEIYEITSQCCKEFEGIDIDEIDAALVDAVARKVLELSTLTTEEIKQNPF